MHNLIINYYDIIFKIIIIKINKFIINDELLLNNNIKLFYMRTYRENYVIGGRKKLILNNIIKYG